MSTNVSKGIRHQWPDSAPPGSTSGHQACSRCKLVRKAERGTQHGLNALRFYWRYSRDGERWEKVADACQAQQVAA